MKTAARTHRHWPLTSLILPTYNPGTDIERTWNAVKRFRARSAMNWEILFVCDGCTDGTPEKLEQMNAASDGSIRVVSYPENRGKGHAVRVGMHAAQGQWRIFTDVDLAYTFRSVERIARALRSGADVAIASRDHPESEWILPSHLIRYISQRQRQSRIFGWLARRLLPLTHHDTQAGLKGLSQRAVEKIMPRMRCAGFGFDCELLTACVRLGIPVVEVPIRVRYRDAASTTSKLAIFRMVRELFRIRRDWRDVLPEPLGQVDSDPQRQAA